MTDNTTSTQNWQPKNFKYLPMTKSDRGNKSVQVQNNETKRALRLRAPLMMTWGIADYYDEKTGELFQMDNLPEGVDMSDITNNILPNDPNMEEPNG